MTPAQEATALREIACLLLLADERATSMCRIASEETEEVLEQVGRGWGPDADALWARAHDLAPTNAPLPLFAWMTEEARV